jgi:BolA protein
MGPLESTITDKLTAEFNPQLLQVTNESYMHSVPEGSESHFKVVIVTDKFAGKRLVQRHQAIYGLLADELRGPVHALALHTYMPDEWSDNHAGAAPDSPNCLGGSKVD